MTIKKNVFPIALLLIAAVGTAAYLWLREPDPDPLMVAVLEDDVGQVKELLAKGFDPDATAVKKSSGHSAFVLEHSTLSIAMAKGNLEIIELLLDHGADPGWQSNVQRTPIDELIRYNDLATITAVLASVDKATYQNRIGLYLIEHLRKVQPGKLDGVTEEEKKQSAEILTHLLKHEASNQAISTAMILTCRSMYGGNNNSRYFENMKQLLQHWTPDTSEPLCFCLSDPSPDSFKAALLIMEKGDVTEIGFNPDNVLLTKTVLDQLREKWVAGRKPLACMVEPLDRSLDSDPGVDALAARQFQERLQKMANQ